MSEAVDRTFRCLPRDPASQRGRRDRLSFQQKCAAFYLWSADISNTSSPKPSGISQSRGFKAPSIAYCLDPIRPGVQRGKYASRRRRMAARSASADDFAEKYYTVDIEDRLARFRMKVPPTPATSDAAADLTLTASRSSPSPAGNHARPLGPL